MEDDDSRRTDRTTTRAVTHTRRRPGRIKLRVLNGRQAGAEYAIDGKHARVGRSSTADVMIDEPSVSGQHFDLRITSQGIEVTDLGSTNGTSLFGRRIRSAFILPGDTVVAGTCAIQLIAVDEIEVHESEELRADGLVGSSAVMREMFAAIEKLGPTELTVLITGETGTGKNTVAQAIHRRSSRCNGPFVVVDGGSLHHPLAAATLVGYVRGALPDVDTESDKAGSFEKADGGTIFIDEIADVPPDLQLVLLRVLTNGEVTRIGERQARRVDVRVIAASRRDLRELVVRNAFREDLYFRLAQSVVEVPPLREREDDVERLARVFLERIVDRDKVPRVLAAEAVAILHEYSWPGNVRELENAIDCAAALCNQGVIRPKDLALPIAGRGSRDIRLAELLRAGSYLAIHDELDRWMLPRILEEAGSLRQAAQLLRIGRKRLTTRLIALGLH